MPKPPSLVVWNGWNKVSTSSGKPTPQSSTPMRISFSATKAVSVSLRSSGGFDSMASHAFTIKVEEDLLELHAIRHGGENGRRGEIRDGDTARNRDRCG
jgi:hypothetical protein